MRNKLNAGFTEITNRKWWINSISIFLLYSKSNSCDLYKFELEDIKDYSIYTLNELNLKLKQFKCIVNVIEGKIIANFESKYTILILKYNKEGVYLSKIHEKWK